MVGKAMSLLIGVAIGSNATTSACSLPSGADITPMRGTAGAFRIVSICVITVANGWGTIPDGHVHPGAHSYAAVAQHVAPHVMFAHPGAPSTRVSCRAASSFAPPPLPQAPSMIAIATNRPMLL